MPASQRSFPALVLRVLAIASLIVFADFLALRLDFRQPFFGYGIGGAFLLFVAARPGWKQVAIVVSAAAMIAFFVLARIEDAATLLVQLVGSLGLATLLFLFCKAVWELRQLRRETMRILLPASVLTFMVLGAQ